MRVADIVADLLAAGHPYCAVWDEYCIEELQLHYEALIRRRAREEIDLSRCLRMSEAGKRDYRKYMKALGDTGEKIEEKMGRRPSVEKIFAGFDAAVNKARGR